MGGSDGLGDGGVWLSAASAKALASWMGTAGNVALVASFLLFLLYEHTVLNFPKR